MNVNEVLKDVYVGTTQSVLIKISKLLIEVE